MDEMNKIPDEQNNEELKEKKTTTPEPSEINEPAVEASEPATETPIPKAPMSKLPLIIGGVVAGVAAIAVSVVIAIVFMFASYNEPACKHDDPTKIVACEAIGATCQETGLTEGMKCTLCDTMVVAQMVIPKKDCIEGNWIVDKEATKTEDGKKHTECTMCHRKMQDVIIPASSQGLRYTLNDDGESYSVAGMGSCTDTDIVIPNTYNGKPVTTIRIYAFQNCSTLTSVVIPDSVTTIGNWAFYSCSSLNSVVIGDGVTTIGEYAFYKCSSLNSVVIGDSVTTIGEDAFRDCSSLTSVVIPYSVTSIGEGAFALCESLTSVVIPDSVTDIGYAPFAGCNNLVSIEVDEDNPNYKSINGHLCTKDGKTLIQYAGGTPDTNAVISDGVTTIGYGAFSYCTNIYTIAIPDSVTTIGTKAFYYCSSLNSVVIGDSVTTIGLGAFYYCSSLASIVIPDSVTSIGDGAFYYCSKLKDVYYTGSEEEWKAITIGSSNDYLTNATIHYNYVPEE